jgi:hypothetical protein
MLLSQKELLKKGNANRYIPGLTKKFWLAPVD